MKSVIPLESIEQRVLMLRGHKVLLDRDLARLYGVETRALNQAVKRNRERFPDDFMFWLIREEIMRISQPVISSSELKYSGFVFRGHNTDCFVNQYYARIFLMKKNEEDEVPSICA